MKMLAAFSPGSDFKRYYRGRMPRLALAVIIVMPLMYGALYLWAFWDPFGHVNKIPVALVNSDRGAEVGGEKINAGAEAAQGLIDSGELDLTLLSEEEAKEGVAHGKYYFSITLPEDFSEAIASSTTDHPRSAELIFTYNGANNYLATIIGQDAAQQVVNNVAAQVGAKTFDIAFTMVDPMTAKITEAADGAGELASGLKTAKGGADELNDGVQQLAGAVMEATDPVLQFAQSLEAGISPAEMRETVDRIERNTETLSSTLEQGTTAQGRIYDAVAGVQSQLRASGDPNLRALADLLEPARNDLYNRGLGPNAHNDLTAIRTDTALLSAQLSDPSSPLRMAESLFESGGLANDIETLRGGVTQLSDGTEELASGLGELSSGADQLASGLQEGASAIPHLSKKQEDALADVLGAPVVLTERYDNEVYTFGDGFAPFFFGLALFVGSIIAWMLFTPLQARPIANGLGSVRVVLASYAPTFGVGVLQALLLFLVTVFAIGMKPHYPVATFFFMLLMVAMFLAMIQMFNALFGPAVGRVVTLAFLMIMLTSAGGIYPVPTTTLPFQYIHWVDPMTYTVNGLRQLIMGGVDYRFWGSMGVIIVLTLVFLVVSTWAARRNRQYNMDRLYPPVEV